MGELQVDAWGAFVPGRGNLATQIQTGVVEEVRRRNLPGLTIEEGNLMITKGVLDKIYGAGAAREYLFFTQALGKTAKASLALRIASKGTFDLELSWRLFESNASRQTVLGLSQGATVFTGFSIAGAGLITSIFGFGLPAIPIGIGIMGAGLGWWGKSKGESQLTPEQKLDARVLVQTINYCLMITLDHLGISSGEVRTLQASQMEGIGKL